MCVATSLSLGWRHSCFLVLNEEGVKCWGVNGEGQLGVGDALNRGVEAGEMGRGLFGVDFGGGLWAVSVSSGSSFTCAVLGDGSVKCWGRNEEGQLGVGSDVVGLGAKVDEVGEGLPDVDLGGEGGAVGVSAGFTHVCAVTCEHFVKCWGENLYGQLGLGDGVQRGHESGGMGDGLPVVELGVGVRVVSVSSGRYHSCALLEDESVKCWGYNEFGGLGVGDSEHRGDGAGEMGENLPAVDFGVGRGVRSVSAG
eukprot:CAMPEP_0174915802 /NCGR_PEP_ID=MMETSP1355-20121228/1375_1 /TAXON_ID=464990 /ORGANISM="Hemiselmis tepida, Strain CCMP443" /LENGTH=252 /DNA_ID=CAMNT_0016160743 /DNA_START=60 /DNA_END=814 /DNA_ORIENTATION=-